MEAMFERTPPHSLEAEQAVLGSILLDGEKILAVSEIIGPEDFYRGAHGRIYQTMLNIAEAGEPIDLITVSAALHAERALEDIGGAQYLTALLESVPTAANATYYAGIVAEKSLLRQLIRQATNIIESAYMAADEANHILVEAERRIGQLAIRHTQKDFIPIADVLRDLYLEIERSAKQEAPPPGLTSGFHDLDGLLGGFKKNDLIIIAARPSVGKTAFALNIAQNIAIRHGQPVAMFSLEMSVEQLAWRMLAAEATLSTQTLRKGQLAEKDWEKLVFALTALGEAPIYIDDTPGITTMDMRARLKRLMREVGPLGLVVIDYLQLITGRLRGGENRQQEISDISRQLKSLARELEVPVIALSQLSRAVESRQDKRPMLSDLRDSGSIEQDADIVAFLYRDDYYNPETDEKNIVEIIVAKHRNGPTGRIKLAFLKEFNKFVNIARPYQEAMITE
ncbi:MAG: Replicative DNA helicase [Candidatus Carbobacillus altaicus]|uniref:Replicative DNA helicase n=1 Tax=Candidatus Carbonibacillus altaicus TaxID=2163959 RepID=A0A2R6XY95_9BACL|nr:MAG: Replicative DNA helicase [Candidatus Carbobacillus altaicus]